MATTCPHGYPENTCIICQTLNASRGRPATGVAAPPDPVRPDVLPHDARRHGPTTQAEARQVADPKGSGRRLGFTPSILLVVLAVVVLLGVVWAVAGLVFAILRIVELVAAVVVAGGIGYRVGRARGRRER